MNLRIRILSAVSILVSIAAVSPVRAAEPESKTSALATLAQSMKPGQWAELKTEGIGTKLLSDGGHHALQYTDEAVWNPVTRELLFSGQGHGASNRFVIFKDATNRWASLPIPAEYDAEKREGWGFVHAYDHQAIDAATGTYYRTCYNRSDIRAMDRDGQWRLVTEIPERFGVKGHITRGFDYFPEMNALVVYLSGTGLFAYDLERKEWRTLAEKIGTYAYHEIARYNPKHKLLVFGGGNDSKGFVSRNLWKLEASGKVTALKDAPFPIGIMQTIFTVDPVSGNYLVFNRAGEFHTFDATNETWTKVMGEKPPIFTVGSDRNAGPIFGCVAAPISTHGVVMFVKYGGDDSRVFLYKHAVAATSR
jgi:hypothetical protein